MYIEKWSDIIYKDICFPDIRSSENRQTILGFFLDSQGINLEKLPRNFFESFSFFPTKENHDTDKFAIEKIYLKDIVGSSYERYSCDNQIIFSFVKLKRITEYIKKNRISKNKLSRILKDINYETPVILSRTSDGKYYVDGNGNHRVITYKILMLSEIARKYSWVFEEDYDLNFNGFSDITKKYWLYAKVRK